MRDSNPILRVQAATALVDLAASQPEAERALVDALSDRCDDVRLVAVRAVTELGPRATNATGRLQRMVAREPNSHIRASAATALGSVARGENWAIPALRTALRDASPDVRAAAARALGVVGAPALGALPDLAGLARFDTVAVVRLAARDAVAALSSRP